MKAIGALLTLLLVFANSFGQTKKPSTFKVRKAQPLICLLAIDSDYWDKDNALSKEQLLHTGKLQIVGNFKDTIKLIGFIVALQSKPGSFIERVSQSDSLTTEMRAQINSQVDGEYIIIKGVQCLTRSGQKFFINGSAVKIDSKHKIINRNLHYPIILTALVGIDSLKDSISKTKLLQIGRIEARGENTDSSKILSFSLEMGFYGSAGSYESNNEYLTPEMRTQIMQLPQGAYIIFKNVRCRLSSGKIKLLTDMSLRIIQ